jgi:hypothetical protein
MKSTNRSRELLAAVAKGEVPAMWKKYAVPELPINSWCANHVALQFKPPTHLRALVASSMHGEGSRCPNTLLLHRIADFVLRVEQTTRVAEVVMQGAKDGVPGLPDPVRNHGVPKRYQR